MSVLYSTLYPIDRIFAIAFAFSRVIGRFRVRYARGLLAPLLTYSLPTGCYLVTILAEKQRKNTAYYLQKINRQLNFYLILRSH